MLNQNLENTASSQECNGRFVKGQHASEQTEFKKGTHWRPRKPHWDKAWLENEYITKQNSTGDIAKGIGCTDANIIYWLRKHGIKRRTTAEARAVKRWEAKGEKNGMYGRCGQDNPRWIDGSSPLRQKMYARSFWKELAKSVYERDNYKCIRCGAGHTSKNKLHAHHVKPWAGNEDSRFELENIVTLCQSCHNWVHSKENVDNEYLSS